MTGTGGTTDWNPTALREAREAAGWSLAEAARQLREIAPQPLPAHDSLVRSWKRWEHGSEPGRFYRPLLAQLMQASDPSHAPGVVGVYMRRGSIPAHVWERMLHRAQHRVEILVYAGLFLPEQHPDLTDRLARIAKQGGRVRLLFGDPDCQAVGARSVEEGIGANAIGAKIRNVLAFYKPLRGQQRVEIRLHRSPLYHSIYRFDDEMIVNPHVYGLPGAQSPALRLRDGALFATYLRAFDAVWSVAEPAWKGP